MPRLKGGSSKATHGEHRGRAATGSGRRHVKFGTNARAPCTLHASFPRTGYGDVPAVREGDSAIPMKYARTVMGLGRRGGRCRPATATGDNRPALSVGRGHRNNTPALRAGIEGDAPAPEHRQRRKMQKHSPVSDLSLNRFRTQQNTNFIRDLIRTPGRAMNRVASLATERR